MPVFDDLLQERDPPPKRAAKTDGEKELHLTEAAVMLAFALHLLEALGVSEVEIHPDGEHGKRFDIRGWLEGQGFAMTESIGTTTYGGRYERSGEAVVVTLQSGLGDVVARGDDHLVVAECKGGVVNTRHAGQKSKLRRGLCEAVGLLMTRPSVGERNLAVVPFTDETERLAKRMSDRSRTAGVEIALVHGDGTIVYVRSPGASS